MSKYVPKVGDVVRLNDDGYRSIKLNSADAVRQSQRMVITSVENINPPDYEPIWTIQVDQPAINKYLLDSFLVEPIKE